MIIENERMNTSKPRSGDFELTPSDERAMAQTRSKNSLCDIIMQGVPKQVTEVIEHILHYVTDIGLHYTFPDEWGISTTSELYEAMQEAVGKNYYDIAQYSDSGEEMARRRVILQELAYWTSTPAGICWSLMDQLERRGGRLKIALN